MFPDLARDDVFRLETPRLWLRWPGSATPPRSINFAANGRSPATPPASPTPIRLARPSGSAYAAREANSSGPRFDPGDDADQGQADAIGWISLEFAGRGPSCARLCAGAGDWGKGLATEAAPRA